MIRVLVIDVDLCINHICKKILIFNAFLSYNDITVFLVGVFSVHCILYYIYFALFSTYTYYVLCIKQITLNCTYTLYICIIWAFKKTAKLNAAQLPNSCFRQVEQKVNHT